MKITAFFHGVPPSITSPPSTRAPPGEKRCSSLASSSSPPQPVLDRCDRVGYARGPDGPLAASRYDEPAHKDRLTCLSCEGCLVFRKPHKRTRAGSEYQVCAHFMHKTGRPASCTNESIEHKCAKAKAAQGAVNGSLTFVHTCDACKERIPISFRATYAREEVPFGKFRLDVGLIGADSSVVGAIEIFHTHALDETKVDALNANENLAWIEVTSTSILDAIEGNGTGPVTIEVRRSAMSERRGLRAICWGCRDTAENTRRRRMHEAESVRIDTQVDRLHIEQERKLVVELRELAQAEEAKVCAVALRHEQQARLELARRVRELMEADTAEARHNVDRLTELVTHPTLVFPSGKHVGEHFDDVWHDDPAYIAFVAGFNPRCRQYGRPAPASKQHGFGKQMVQRARECLQGACYLCGEETGEDWKTWCTRCYCKVENA